MTSSRHILRQLSCMTLLTGVVMGCGPYGFEKHWDSFLKVRQAKIEDLNAKRVVPDDFILSVRSDSFEPSEHLSKSERLAYLVDKLSLGDTSTTLLAEAGEGEDRSILLKVSLSRLSKSDKDLILTNWETDDRVQSAEPDWVSRPHSSEDTFEGLSLNYGNSANGLWLKKIRLSQAFLSLTSKPRPVKERPIVVVMDSGVDISHRALAGQILDLSGYDHQCGDGTSGCNVTTRSKSGFGDGRVWPVGTESFGTSCDRNGSKVCLHGTHVSGIIAANLQQGYGGICPDCLILPLKVVSEEGPFKGSIVDSSLISGLAYLIHLKKQGLPIRVVNASFGKFRRSRTVSLLLKQLSRMGQGTLIVAAAGNEGTQKPQFPAALDEVLSVANIVSDSGARHQSSNFGHWVDISAPGSGTCGDINRYNYSYGIYSSIPGGSASCEVGTSFAAPIVSGVAGLVLSSEPNLTAAELKDRLLGTADRSFYDNKDNSLFKGFLGSGIVDALAAVQPSEALGAETGEKNHRKISAGCGTLAVSGPEDYRWVMLLLLLSPVLAAMIFHRGRTHARK